MRNNGNILLVANWESSTGYAWWLMENFWIIISDYFEPKGLSSYLIYPGITQIPASITKSNITVLEHDIKNHSLSSLGCLHNLIKKYNIHYIYLTDSPSYSLLYILLKIWGVRVIAIHDHTPGDRLPPPAWKKLLKTSLQKTPYYTADHFIAVSNFVYRRFIDVACIPPVKCSCAPNGIIPIDLQHTKPGYAHETFGIPENRSIVVTTGRASHYKGIDFFIECANELVNIQGHKQLHFLYCGDGPDINDFKSLVNEYSLRNHFTFSGNRTDIRQILPSCYVGFHAALGEVGYSLSILEYMSAGLVTIVPNLPSTSQAIIHMENGILYKSRDLESATTAIIDTLNDDKYKNIRVNAIRSIQDKYDITSTNKRLIDILGPLFSSSNIL